MDSWPCQKRLVFQPLLFSRAKNYGLRTMVSTRSGWFPPFPKWPCVGFKKMGVTRPIVPYPYQVNWAPWKAPSAPRLFANHPPPESPMGEDCRDLPGTRDPNSEFLPVKKTSEFALKGNLSFKLWMCFRCDVFFCVRESLFYTLLLKCSPWKGRKLLKFGDRQFRFRHFW